MRYLIALILPPLAILFCGRPVSAILNVTWIIFGFVSVYVLSFFGLIVVPLAFLGAVIHAVLVVSKTSADERQRELITALGGKLPPRKNWELDLAAIIMGLALVAAAIAIILEPQRGLIMIQQLSPNTEHVDPTSPTVSVPTLPSIETWTMEEVISRHGKPLKRDSDSGWAYWSTFRARFKAGSVEEVSPP